MKWFECRSVKKAFRWREGEDEKRGKGYGGGRDFLRSSRSFRGSVMGSWQTKFSQT